MTDVLGMPYHFWIVVVALGTMIFALERNSRRRSEVRAEEEARAEELNEVKLFGGPLHGKVDQVNNGRADYYIVPYMPEDPEEKQQLGMIGDKVIYAPNFAFYQNVGEPEVYFHRRDLTHEEFQAFTATGLLPEDLG